MGTRPRSPKSASTSGSAARIKSLIGLHGDPKVTNSARIEEVLGLKKDTQTKFGQSYDLNRPEVMRQLAMSGPEGQALLQKHWQSLPPEQKQSLIREVVEAMPHPSKAAGVSVDAKKIFDVLKTGKLDEASQQVIANAEAGLGFAKTADAPQPRSRAGSAPAPIEQAAAPTMPDGESPVVSTAAPPGQYHMEAAEDIRRPTESQRLPRPIGFDPKEKGLKDPSGGTSIEDRPPLRSPPSRVEMVDGKPMRVVEDEGGAVGREDMGAFRAGRDWEAAQDARAKFQLDLLVQTQGSQEAVADLFKRAGSGDKEAQATIDASRRVAAKEVPIPMRPKPANDFQARKSETSPQAIYDQHVMSAAVGKPGASVYSPKAGQSDHLMEIWKGLATKFGKEGTPLGPQSVFNSPTEMAQFVLRNASPEMLDVMPVTPKQRALAELAATMKDLPPNADKGRIVEAAKEYSPDAPYSGKDRNVVNRQAVERLAAELESRFGSSWGADYRAGQEATDAASPQSTRGAELGGSTTQDPSQIPSLDGSANRASQPTDLSVSDEEFARRLDEFQRIVGPPRDMSYLSPDVPYAAQPTRPARPQQDPSLADVLNDPNRPVIEAEGAATRPAGPKGKARFEEMLQKQIDEAMAEEWNPKPVGRTYNELSPDEQWKAGYANDPASNSPAEYNRRNPGTSPEDLARRDRLAEDAEAIQPQIMRARLEGETDRTSLLLKELDSVDAELQQLSVAHGDGRPESALDISKYNELESRRADLRERLTIAQRIDQMTGVRSMKKGPPLGGRVGKNQPPAEAGPDPLDFVEDDGSVVETRPVPPVEKAPATGSTTAKPKSEAWLRDGIKRSQKAIKSLGGKKLTEAKLQAARSEYAEMKAFGDTLTGEAKSSWEREVLAPLQQAGTAAKGRVPAPKAAAAAPVPAKSAAEEVQSVPAEDLNAELAGEAVTPDAARAADEAHDAEMQARDLDEMPVDEEVSADAVAVDPEPDAPAVYPAPAVVRQPIEPEMIDPLESSATPLDEPIDVEFEVKQPRADSAPDAEAKVENPMVTTPKADADAAEAAAKADDAKAPKDAEAERADAEAEADAGAKPGYWDRGFTGMVRRNPKKSALIAALAAGAGYQYQANQKIGGQGEGIPGSAGSGPGAGGWGAGQGAGMAGAQGVASVGDASMWSPDMSSYERIRRLRQMDGTANQKTPQTFYNWRGDI